LKIEIVSKDQEAIRVLEKLVKKKQRGVKIIGHLNEEGIYKASFVFNKILSAVSKGFEKYVLPQQKEFIIDFMSEEGIPSNKYEVLIE
jgi:hypothetical protein